METKNLENITNTQWIENLAFEELNMDESGVVEFNNHLSADLILEEESIKFMDKLKGLLSFTSLNSMSAAEELIQELQLKFLKFQIQSMISCFLEIH